jgi:two-component system sensor histidine kinase TtrS
VRKDQPERRLIDLRTVIREAGVLFEPEARRAGVQLRMQLGDAPVQVMAQPIQIEQVILNLARNAIEAMTEVPPGQRRLVIETSSDAGGGSVEVSVEDSGPGLGRELLSEVFNPFVTTKPNGLGLGLSISLGIIEAHKGQLRVESEPGSGACFSFTLPADETQPAAPRAAETAAAPACL